MVSLRPSRPFAVRGLSAPLELRESVRTRRLTLRLDPGRGLIQVVVPAGSDEADVIRFVNRHTGWIEARLAALPPARPFLEGASIPVLGAPHTIRHDPGCRGAGQRSNGEIRVGGAPEHLPRRVRDLLVAESRRVLSERARVMADSLGTQVRGIAVRDTRSRWGSCSSKGRLSFSWRLILTPEPVLNYVVAHEVAHLHEMNHSSRFWTLVGRLVPDAAPSRAWLRSHGAELLRLG